MRRALTIGLMIVLGGTAAEAQDTADGSPLEARVWLDRGDQPVLQRGDRVRVYYRTSVDAHTAIFRIDTDGRVTLVRPAHPEAEQVTRGGRDYCLLFSQSARWVVGEYPGMGYYFIVAAEQPLDFSRLDFVPDEDRWDLGRVGETVYEDPYVAIDAYVAALIPDWEVAPYALDFIEYSVGESHSYPRFLCYDCHGQRPYTNWNPYTYACTDFRVVLWDDPYYYPAYRYAGTRVVFPRPLRNRPRYTVVVGATGEGWSPLVRYRQAPPLPRRATQYKELGVATTPSSAAPTRRPQNRVPSAGIRSAAPRRPASAPSRAAANPNATRRTAEAATPSAASPRHTNSSGSTPRAATSRPGTSSRRAEQPANARPGTSRSASPRLATPSRPTLQRRPAAKTTRGATSGRTNASRPNLRPSTSRGSAVSGWRTRVVAPSRPSGPPRAQPQTQQRRRGSAMPTRSAPSTRSRPTATRARPTTTRARPATSGARPTTSRPATRSAPARHPTVSARPKPPPRRGGRGG